MCLPIAQLTQEEGMPQDVDQASKETPPKPQVIELKKEAPIVRSASYHHPHLPARQ